LELQSSEEAVAYYMKRGFEDTAGRLSIADIEKEVGCTPMARRILPLEGAGAAEGGEGEEIAGLLAELEVK